MKIKSAFSFFIAAVLIGLYSTGHAEDTRYQIIDPFQPTQSGDKIEVVEFFWYGCPHCYALEPYLEHWEKSLPDDVAFRRIPGVLGSNWIPHARAYYTAQKLGMVDKIHRPLFDAIHKERKRIDNQKSLADFFAAYGVDKDEFNRIYESDAVTDQLKQAFITAKNYGIRGVPAIIVNGKYLTTVTLTGGDKELIVTINDLIEKERNGN